jgi:hypothetical protein
MRNLRVVTSQNQEYYNLIGKDCLISFLKYWPKEISIDLWAENFVPDIVDPRINIKPWINVHKNLEDFWSIITGISREGRHMRAKKFYLKAHVVLESWRTADYDVFIWLDSDTITHKEIPFDFLDNLCPSDTLSVDVPHGGKGWQREADTGFFMLNMRSDHAKDVIDYYRRYHTSDLIFKTFRNIETSVWWDAVELSKKNGAKVNHLDITVGEPDSFKTTILSNYMIHYINTQKKHRSNK